MGFFKPDKDKEFNCRQCSTYLDSTELVDGKCPNCKTDEDLFMNDIENEDDDIIDEDEIY